jgi:hypothetical protein
MRPLAAPSGCATCTFTTRRACTAATALQSTRRPRGRCTRRCRSGCEAVRRPPPTIKLRSRTLAASARHVWNED